MKILFFSVGRLKNINDRGIYTDLLRELRDRGNDVYVVGARQRRENLPTEFVTEDGVKFLRVRVGNITKSNPLEKGIATLRIEGQFLSAIKKYLGDVKFDVVLYSTPPVTFDRVIRYIKKRDGAASYLMLKDIFPQNAVDMGMMKKGGLIWRWFRRKEVNLYRNSDHIGCMSPANVRYLLENNSFIDHASVEICPNAVDPVDMSVGGEEAAALREKYAIPTDKTVCVFGGNLGRIQAIPYLIEVIRAAKDMDGFHFLVAGSGNRRYLLEEFIAAEHPANLTLLENLPKDEYDRLAGSCDIGIVLIDHSSTIPNFPSRMLACMQAKIPVICATDPNCDSGAIAREGDFGYGCSSDDANGFLELLEQLSDPVRRRSMGDNAWEYLNSHYTVRQAADVLLAHFNG